MRKYFFCNLVFFAAVNVCAGTPVEKRCADLGANCSCSEPLNTTSYVRAGGTGNYLADFADSEGAGAKECGPEYNGSRYFYGGFHDPNAYITFTAPSGMPAGNTVSHVLDWVQAPTNGSDGGGGRKDLITANTRRVCMRYYWQAKSTVDSASPCSSSGSGYAGFKSMQLKHNGPMHAASIQAGLSTSEFLDGMGLTITNTYTGAQSDNNYPGWDQGLPSSAALKPEHCYNEWCSLELCVSGNVQAGMGMKADYIQYNMSRTNHYDSRDYYPAGLDIGNAPNPLSDVEPLMLYGDTCTVGRRFSHVIQATWDIDRRETIGPACEIEPNAPGCGGSSVPPLLPPGTPKKLQSFFNYFLESK